MAHIMITWEHGNLNSHLFPLRTIAKFLQSSIQKITFVLKDITQAERILGKDNFLWFQAPYLHFAKDVDPLIRSKNYTQVLYNFGFSNEKTLLNLLRAWHDLYLTCKPDAIIFNNSPTALVAATGLNIPKILIGNGFSIPPKSSPLPCFHEWLDYDVEKLRCDEEKVVETINAACYHLKQPAIHRLSDIFSVDYQAFLTFPDLDHYNERKGVDYLGIIPFYKGMKPE